MISEKTDFFQLQNNFEKYKHVISIPIIESKLDFIPEVTIAIVTYKRAELLKEAIDSAIKQNKFHSYEIVIVDDFPERNCDTEKMVKTYSDKKLSYYKNAQNIGLFGNYNRCIELSKGNYLTILNDDDLLHPDFLSIVATILIEKPKIDGLFCSFYPIREGYIEAFTEKKHQIGQPRKMVFIESIFGSIINGALGSIVKKKVYQEMGGYNELFYPSADYVFWANFIKRYNVYSLADKLAYFRISVNISLQVESQWIYYSNDKFFRSQIIHNMGLLKWIFKPSLSILEYNHFNGICNFSKEFEELYSERKHLLKKRTKLINILSYSLLMLYSKSIRFPYKILELLNSNKEIFQSKHLEDK